MPMPKKRKLFQRSSHKGDLSEDEDNPGGLTKQWKKTKEEMEEEAHIRVDAEDEFPSEDLNISYGNATEEYKSLERSGSTDLDKSLLNDELRSRAAGSDDSRTRILGRGEDRQIKEDDQRCDLEVKIEVNNTAIRDLNSLLGQMAQLTRNERQTLLNDDSFPWIYRKAIMNSFPKAGEALNVIAELKSQPCKIIPKVVEQLKIRNQKWEEKKSKLFLNRPINFQVVEHACIVKMWKEVTQRSLESEDILEHVSKAKEELLAENRKLTDANATLEMEKRYWKEKYENLAKDANKDKKLLEVLRTKLEDSKDGSEYPLNNKSYQKADLKDHPRANDSNKERIRTRRQTAADPNEKLLHLQESSKGKLAVLIFDVIAYLKAEPIPRDFFYELLLKYCSSKHLKRLRNVNKEKIHEAVDLLERNSLLFATKADLNQEFLKILPDAQAKRRRYLANNKKEEDTLVILLQLLDSEKEGFPRKNLELAVNVWPMAWNYPKLVQCFSHLILKMVRELKNMEKGVIHEGVEFGKKALNKLKEILGQDHLQCFELQLSICSVICKQGELEEAANLLKDLVQKMKEPRFGERNLFNRIQMMLSNVLAKLGLKNLEEAFAMQHNVIEKYRLEYGEHHSKTIDAEYSYAKGLFLKGGNKMALEILGHVEQKRIKLLGGNHITVLETRLTIARANLQLGNVLEALKTVRGVYQEMSLKWEEHVEPFAKVCILLGSTLNGVGKYSETLEFLGEKYDQIKNALGAGHPSSTRLVEIIEHAQRKNRDDPVLHKAAYQKLVACLESDDDVECLGVFKNGKLLRRSFNVQETYKLPESDC